MGLFRKHLDPIREHERQLNARIAELQSEIASLSHAIEEQQTGPRLRSTAQPHAPPAPGVSPTAAEPTFEQVSHQRVTNPFTNETTAAHYNELGVRKYDLLATWRRWLRQLRGSATSNPKLVSYLAVGSVHGLRPLRYEKRVARNRFLALCAVLLLLIWGLIYMFIQRR